MRHYNNIIAANEENCYKIARDQTGQAAGNEGPRRGLESARRPMAAATSAAISMEMRWMCPLFCMIKYRRKKRLGKPDPPPYPAGAVVRERRERENMSKNPCTESERNLSSFLCLIDNIAARWKRNAFSENLVKHGDNDQKAKDFAAKRALGTLVRTAGEKPAFSTEFPLTDVSLSPLTRLYNSTPRCLWPTTGCLVKYRHTLSFRFADRK